VLEGGCATPFGAYVEGECAWLGQALAPGWKSCSVALPERPTPDERERFIHQVLAEEVKGDGVDGEWLFQSV
jgi:hypothetical protein